MVLVRKLHLEDVMDNYFLPIIENDFKKFKIQMKESDFLAVKMQMLQWSPVCTNDKANLNTDLSKSARRNWA